jgi:hypothetical protein
VSVFAQFGRDHRSITAGWEAATGLGRRGAQAEKERAMRLNSEMAERALSQFDAQIIPDSHPAVQQLNRLYGDHTFFLDGDGLHIVQALESPERFASTHVARGGQGRSRGCGATLRPHVSDCFVVPHPAFRGFDLRVNLG